MHRSIVESLITCAGSLTIAVAVFVAGTSATQTTAQPITPPGNLTPSLQPVTSLPASSAAGDQTCRTESIMAQSNSGVRGKADLCVSGAGVQSRLNVEGLSVGHAYAVLLAYFDQASSCRTPVCRIDDAMGLNPIGVLVHLDGAVAIDNKSEFGRDFRDLRPTPQAQILFLLFDNGYASSTDNRLRARQLFTPRSPRLGAPAAGAVADGEAGYPTGYAAFAFRPDP